MTLNRMPIYNGLYACDLCKEDRSIVWLREVLKSTYYANNEATNHVPVLHTVVFLLNIKQHNITQS